MAGNIYRIVREPSRHSNRSVNGFDEMRRFNNGEFMNELLRNSDDSNGEDTIDINLFIDEEDQNDFPTAESLGSNYSADNEQDDSTTESSTTSAMTDSDDSCIYLLERVNDIDYARRLQNWRLACISDTFWGGLIVFAIYVIFLAVVLVIILKIT